MIDHEPYWKHMKISADIDYYDWPDWPMFNLLAQLEHIIYCDGTEDEI